MNQNAENFARIAQGKHPYVTSIHRINNYTPSPINAKSDLYVYVCSFTLNFVLIGAPSHQWGSRKPEIWPYFESCMLSYPHHRSGAVL